jgi:hypothetical protein
LIDKKLRERLAESSRQGRHDSDPIVKVLNFMHLRFTMQASQLGACACREPNLAGGSRVGDPFANAIDQCIDALPSVNRNEERVREVPPKVSEHGGILDLVDLIEYDERLLVV